MHLTCWLFGHKWVLEDDDVQVVKGAWHLAIFRCLRCGVTKLMTV